MRLVFRFITDIQRDFIASGGGPMQRRAILLACDQGYAPFAAFLIHQIRLFEPHSDYDIILASLDDLILPDTLDVLNIRQIRIDPSEVPPVYERIGMPMGYFVKPFAIDKIAPSYDRILYLDADMSFEGGDLMRLLSLDLKGRVLAAALDVWYLRSGPHISNEFKALNWGPIPYFNAGLLLIDCAEWIGREISQRCASFAEQHPEVLLLHDQSALNCVLRGDFAEMSMAWNWLASGMFPFASHRFPIHIHHFGGKGQKPWQNPIYRYDMRFILAYRDFFQRYWPEMLPGLGGAQHSELASVLSVATKTYAQIKNAPILYPLIARYRDPYQLHFDTAMHRYEFASPAHCHRSALRSGLSALRAASDLAVAHARAGTGLRHRHPVRGYRAPAA